MSGNSEVTRTAILGHGWLMGIAEHSGGSHAPFSHLVVLASSQPHEGCTAHTVDGASEPQIQSNGIDGIAECMCRVRA